MTVIPQSCTITILNRELHYMAWGDPGAPPVILWHGLARTGRDFDDLAAALSDRYYLIAPDTIGRGLSEWSPRPAQEYCLDFYVQLAVGLCDALKIAQLRWVGTSMGGAIGLRAAATPLANRMTHLVLNDIGPEIAPAAVTRIRSYAGKPPSFARISELEAYFRTIYKPYGFLTDAQWRRLVETSTRRLPDGRFTPHYDPAIMQQFENHPEDYRQWSVYDAITAQVLCLRGADSDLLLPDVAQEMTRRGPRCRLVSVPGCGHAPALNVPAQIKLIEDFLA